MGLWLLGLFLSLQSVLQGPAQIGLPVFQIIVGTVKSAKQSQDTIATTVLQLIDFDLHENGGVHAVRVLGALGIFLLGTRQIHTSADKRSRRHYVLRTNDTIGLLFQHRRILTAASSRMMSPAQLLVELESKPHHERQKRVVELGRDPVHTSLFTELEEGTTSYERGFALLSCATSRDGERVLRMLFDSSRRLRAQALRWLSVVAFDEQVRRGASQLPLKTLRRLLVHLRKQGRRDVIDAILEERSATQPNDAASSLIGFASRRCAEHLLKEEFERAADADYGRLARLQPQLSLELVLQMVRALDAYDGVVLNRANAVLAQAAFFRTASERELALHLVRELCRLYSIAHLNLYALFLSGNAQAVAEIVIASGERVRLPWSDRARRLSKATIVAIVQSQSGAIADWSKVLKCLPHQIRAELYQQFNASWQDRHGIIPLATLALLPRVLRQDEARRHLQLANLKANRVQWLSYLSLLPAEEASNRAEHFLGDPDPAHRAAALSAIVGIARFERAHISTALELIEQRANEQDPVRMAMLGMLAALPSSRFNEEHLHALARIQRQALNARDLSYATRASLERLIISLLPRFPEWAGVRMAELLQEGGRLTIFSLENRITDQQMRLLGPRLEPLLQAWAAREHAPFLGLLHALGRRLRVWDAGAHLLGDFLRSGPNEQLATAAEILAKFRSDLWRQIAPELLAEDESWALLPVMWRFLSAQRQDLLSPAILGRRRLQGRFASGSTTKVLPFSDGFWRWTPTQQARFAQTLEDILQDTSRESQGAIYAIDHLSQLPDVPPKALVEQAQLSNSRAAWREAALRVLARLDGGQGVLTLLEALDDERARIAIYGLRRALLEMPAPRAFAILRQVSLQKVTVAKEVVRLLGDLTSQEAFAYLLELSERDLHRDVCVALLRALWEHLEDPRSWVILEREAQSADPAIATMAARTTHPRMSAATRARLNTLLAQLLRHDDISVRLQVLQNGAMGAISDPQQQLLEPLLLCLQSKVDSEWDTAARALWTTYGSAPPTIMRQVIASAIERLLPRRRVLSRILGDRAWESILPRNLRQEVGRLIMEALGRDEVILPLRLTFAVATLKAIEVREMVEDCVGRGLLYENALLALSHSLETTYLHSPHWSTTFETWRTAPSAQLRRLALAILKSKASLPSGWTPERRTLLQEFRHDPSPLVASVAQFTFWPGEE